MSVVNLTVSPCPNDIYTFYAWMNGKIATELACKTSLHDIQTLNQMVLAGASTVSKVSFLTLAQARQDYMLLPIGSAFGYKVGPKLVGNAAHLCLDDLKSQTILVPGRNTTAYLLLRHLFPESTQIEFCAFDEVIPRLLRKEAAFGLIIHESRFALAQHGLYELADMGELWWEKTKTPLPLGCLVAKRNLPPELLAAICDSIKRSLDYAGGHREELDDCLLNHSQEKSLEATLAHIKLYVNADTYCLSASAKEAAQLLLEQAIREKIAIECKKPWLFGPWEPSAAFT